LNGVQKRQLEKELAKHPTLLMVNLGTIRISKFIPTSMILTNRVPVHSKPHAAPRPQEETFMKKELQHLLDVADIQVVVVVVVVVVEAIGI
jgi:hypothetical protein